MILTVARYRTITGDTATAASAVSAAIEDAEQLASEEMDGRILEHGEHTETLILHGGKVYPRALPITSVSASGYEAEGFALTGTFDLDNPPLFGPPALARTEVTYSGGWTADTIPRLVERHIAFIAKALVTVKEPAIVGATSVRLGDAAVSYASPRSVVDELSPGSSAVFHRYRLAEVPR